ncbi:MAG: AAA family ATPase [Candidatus Sulfotelmatobacter sp.]
MTVKVAARRSTELTDEDKKQLARFKIPPALLSEAGWCRLTDAVARKKGFTCKAAGPDAKFDGLMIPYLDAEGKEFNARIRRDKPEEDAEGKPEHKYLMLPARVAPRRGLYILPADRKRLLAAAPEELAKIHVVVVEAEKSVLAATAWARRTGRKDIVFVATGGCRSYDTPDLALLCGHRVSVQWDSNVWTNGQVADAEVKAVVLAITTHGIDAGVQRLPRECLEKGINGLDDFIATNPDSRVTALFAAPRSEPWLDAVGVTWEQYNNTKPPRMFIKDILQEGGVTMLGGLPSALKTWVMLSMVQALLNGTPLFGHFDVPDKAKRVIYLTPEVGRPLFKARLELMGLGNFVQSRQLLFRTVSESRIELTDPNLLLAARGAHVFLDTVIRFIKGDENENKANDTGLGAGCFGLIEAGALDIVGAHHARKSSADQGFMTLESMLRGAGDLGAFVRVAFGLRKISATEDITSTRVYVECVKPGDFNPPAPFVLEGRPYIGQGKGLQMATLPGHVDPATLTAVVKAAQRKPGRPADPGKATRVAEISRLVKENKTPKEISEVVAAGAEAKKWPAIAAKTLRNEIQMAKAPVPKF